MASQDTHMYFIVLKKPKNSAIINPGTICYISEKRYTSVLKRNDGTLTKLPMMLIEGLGLDYELDITDMEPLTVREVELLLAVKNESERLKWFKEKETLKTALGLTENTSVTVEDRGESLKGIIRSICRVTEGSQRIPAIIYGIELQGADIGKGETDGLYKWRRFFECPRNCGVFVPFSKVRPVVSTSLPPSAPRLSPELQTEPLDPGDRVTFMFDENHFGHGMVIEVGKRDGQQMVRLSTDTDKNGLRGGETEVPLNCVVKVKEEVHPARLEPEQMDIDTPVTVPALDTHHMVLDLDSMVEVSLGAGNAYGTIRWIGTLPGREETMAGLEMEDPINGLTDGTFKNKRFFDCLPGRALFIKLLSCRPDSRFQNNSMSCERERKSVSPDRKRKQSGGMSQDPVAPITTERVTEVLIGQMKGIQGHCNSCYMDAALFSLFSCSSVLDSLLFKLTDPQDAHIQETLLYDIVNPLRSEGFVEGRHIMKLRQQLQEHGYSRTFTTDEKDPEEFLTVIMHHILALEPLLKLSAGGKVQESYCYQIFLDQNHSLVLPTVQQLLEHSFHSAALKLAEVPSCLILQMPRFGKKFKMFEKIIPSLELDITDLLSEGPQQCTLCGQLAHEECVDCFKDPLFGPTGFKLFCQKCSSQVHAHPQRRAHRPTRLDMPKGFQGHDGLQVMARDKLELFAVLCIETSHYVSFVKHGPNNHDWIFFDSMADRHGGIDGFNIPQVHACPEVGTYLTMSPAELASHAPKEMKGVAKRLFCDAYMYLYQSTTMCLYR